MFYLFIRIQSKIAFKNYSLASAGSSKIWVGKLSLSVYYFQIGHVQVVHNKDFRYPCEMCDRRFSESGHLRNHMRGVHEKKFVCSLCSFVTETKKQIV